jgi:hypothetical protein
MRYGEATEKRYSASDRVLDDMSELFKTSAKAELMALSKRYKVPGDYTLGVSVDHVEGGYSTTRFRITAGVVTIRREMTIDTALDTVQESSRKLNQCIMDICRTFAQQFGRVK